MAGLPGRPAAQKEAETLAGTAASWKKEYQARLGLGERLETAGEEEYDSFPYHVPGPGEVRPDPLDETSSLASLFL